jgi:hypothetical protein
MAQVFATSFHPDWHIGAILAERQDIDFWCEACRDTGGAMKVGSACSSGADAWRSQEFRPSRRPVVNVAQSAETDRRFDHLTLHTGDLSRTGVALALPDLVRDGRLAEASLGSRVALRIIGFLSGLFVTDVHYNRVVGFVIGLALAGDSDGRANFRGPAASVSVMPSSDPVKGCRPASSNCRGLGGRPRRDRGRAI